jgi:hypothetical protein
LLIAEDDVFTRYQAPCWQDGYLIHGKLIRFCCSMMRVYSSPTGSV